MKRNPLILTLWLILSISMASIAQSECPALVEFALNSTDQFCVETGRNQACFGHVNLSAEAQPDADSFEFVEAGDVVNVATIRSLRLSTLDTASGVWGVVLMRVQANLADTTPGQNVTFMLFGDTEIRNAAQSVAEQNTPTIDGQISSSLDVNVRVGASSDSVVIATISNGTEITVNGISADNQWVRIVIPDSETGQLGWVSSTLVTTTDDLTILNVIEAGQSQFGPMQAFYLSTGIGEPACNEMPDNGLLVQTPKGVGEINLLVNEVEISMGSTVFLSAPRDDDSNDDENINVASMIVKTIEGTALTRINDDVTVALGGSQFEVMYDDEGLVELVGNLESLPLDEIDNLPFDTLERAIELEVFESLTDEELGILERYDELFDVVDIDETDMLLDRIEEFGDEGLFEFLRDDLEIEDFDLDTAEFFERELDIDLEDFDLDAIDDLNEIDDLIPLDLEDEDFDFDFDPEGDDEEDNDDEDYEPEEDDYEEGE